VRVFEKGGGVYLKTAHFVPFTEYPAVQGEPEDGYDVFTARVPSERFHYVTGGGNTGFLKTTRVVYLGLNETERTITADVEKLDTSKREDHGFMADDVYLNVNDAQHLVLTPGETFRLIPTRVWQAMEGMTDNYFIEPDYKIEVLGDSGTISSAWAGSPGLEYAQISALRSGVAVIRVTYGPTARLNDEDDGMYFNAIEPINTGIVVVTVTNGNKTSGITTNIAAREYDTVYFDKDKTDHAEYTFKPSGTGEISVRVHKPIHDGGAEWESWRSDDVKDTDGGFTVNLYEGRNIVEVSSENAAFSEYHVINAKGININVSGDITPGASVEISFKGIKTPLEKIAAIYNPGYPDTCFVEYASSQGGVLQGRRVQYNLSEENAITVTVPESGEIKLTGGVINCDHMGDPLGSHRERIGNGPIYPNFTAANVNGRYCVMPDIILTAGGN
jgi:hypothetical protein